MSQACQGKGVECVVGRPTHLTAPNEATHVAPFLIVSMLVQLRWEDDAQDTPAADNVHTMRTADGAPGSVNGPRCYLLGMWRKSQGVAGVPRSPSLTPPPSVVATTTRTEPATLGSLGASHSRQR